MHDEKIARRTKRGKNTAKICDKSPVFAVCPNAKYWKVAEKTEI